MPPFAVVLGASGSGAAQVGASSNHACALMSSGTVKCWGAAASGGYATEGYVGDDTADFPPPTVALSGQAAALSIGDSGNTCVILIDGTLQCWGSNSSGALGLGHTDFVGNDETPADAGLCPVF